MKDASIGFLGQNGSQGNLPQGIRQGLDVNARRIYEMPNGRSYMDVYKGSGNKNDIANYIAREVNVNATLRRDEWKALDDAIARVARERLIGISDLEQSGLVYNLNSGMGRTVLESHKVSDPGNAHVTMDGKNRGENDRPDYTSLYLPLPIISADFEINERVLQTSRNMGDSIDVDDAESAARRVAELQENMLFTDIKYSFGGGVIYSYLNHPHRNTVDIDTNWDASGATGATILAKVREAKQASMNANYYGPWMMYIPTAYETVLDDDYVSGYPKTIRQRILEVEGITGIKTADRLPANNVLLVQMTSNVVRLVKSLPMTNLSWDSEGGLIHNYKVMTIQVPQIRSDYNEATGIVHIA